MVAGKVVTSGGADAIVRPAARERGFRRAGGRGRPPLLGQLQRLQLLARIPACIHLRVRFGDLALLVDHVGDAADVFVFRRLGGAVGKADLVVGVAEEREAEVELFRETGILFAAVEADAEDLGVFLFVLRLEVPEPGTFGGSAGCVGLRIEPEDDFLAAEIAQPHRAAFVIGGFEVRGRVSDVQHSRSSSERAFDEETQRSGNRHEDIVGDQC